MNSPTVADEVIDDANLGLDEKTESIFTEASAVD